MTGRNGRTTSGRVEYESEYCAFNFEKVGKVDPFDANRRVCGGATRRSASLLDRTEYCDYSRSVRDAVVLARHLRQGQAVTGLIDSITSLKAVKARWMSEYYDPAEVRASKHSIPHFMLPYSYATRPGAVIHSSLPRISESSPRGPAHMGLKLRTLFQLLKICYFLPFL